jgi:putative Mn2+ efflux pump MntP
MKRGVGTGLMTFGAVTAVVGAIMRYAVSVQTDGFNIHIAGMILLVVGVGMVVIGLVAMLLGGRTTSTRQESVQNTPGGQVRTSEWDERSSV